MDLLRCVAPFTGEASTPGGHPSFCRAPFTGSGCDVVYADALGWSYWIRMLVYLLACFMLLCLVLKRLCLDVRRSHVTVAPAGSNSTAPRGLHRVLSVTSPSQLMRSGRNMISRRSFRTRKREGSASSGIIRVGESATDRPLSSSARCRARCSHTCSCLGSSFGWWMWRSLEARVHLFLALCLLIAAASSLDFLSYRGVVPAAMTTAELYLATGVVVSTIVTIQSKWFLVAKAGAQTHALAQRCACCYCWARSGRISAGSRRSRTHRCSTGALMAVVAGVVYIVIAAVMMVVEAVMGDAVSVLGLAGDSAGPVEMSAPEVGAFHVTPRAVMCIATAVMFLGFLLAAVTSGCAVLRTVEANAVKHRTTLRRGSMLRTPNRTPLATPVARVASFKKTPSASSRGKPPRTPAKQGTGSSHYDCKMMEVSLPGLAETRESITSRSPDAAGALPSPSPPAQASARQPSPRTGIAMARSSSIVARNAAARGFKVPSVYTGSGDNVGEAKVSPASKAGSKQGVPTTPPPHVAVAVSSGGDTSAEHSPSHAKEDVEFLVTPSAAGRSRPMLPRIDASPVHTDLLSPPLPRLLHIEAPHSHHAGLDSSAASGEAEGEAEAEDEDGVAAQIMASFSEVKEGYVSQGSATSSFYQRSMVVTPSPSHSHARARRSTATTIERALSSTGDHEPHSMEQAVGHSLRSGSMASSPRLPPTSRLSPALFGTSNRRRSSTDRIRLAQLAAQQRRKMSVHSHDHAQLIAAAAQARQDSPASTASSTARRASIWSTAAGIAEELATPQATNTRPPPTPAFMQHKQFFPTPLKARGSTRDTSALADAPQRACCGRLSSSGGKVLASIILLATVCVGYIVTFTMSGVTLLVQAGDCELVKEAGEVDSPLHAMQLVWYWHLIAVLLLARLFPKAREAPSARRS